MSVRVCLSFVAVTLLLTTPAMLAQQPGAPAAAPAPARSVVAEGATVQKLAGDFAFTEGPTSDRHGNIYFTDQPNNRILRWSVDGGLTTFLQPAGRANGMYFDATGQLLACADEKMELWSIAADGAHAVLPSTYAGKPLNGPNDVWAHPGGGIYLTDPYYQRPWWDHKERPQDGQHVYYLSADRKTLTRVATDFTRPNGIIGTPDGRTLYVADIGASRTYVFDIAPDGRLTNRRLFCESGSDGMTLDTDGRLYLTGKGVMVFNPDGTLLERIDVPEPWTANVSFGGADHQTLFITASKGFYSVRLRAKGANASK